MNNSQVIPARIPMRKATGAKAEILLLSPNGETDPTAALDMPLEKGHSWKCIVGGRRIHPGDVLESDSGAFLLKAEILSRDGTAAMVQFHTDAVGLSLATAIQSIGKTPLPPYIKRAVDADDVRAYQTVYAKRAGSVAAPTAGLHMTEEVLKNIRARGVHISTVTLHVGAGTFAQLGGPTAGDHRMHAERFTVSAETMCHTAECARDQRQLTALVRILHQPALCPWCVVYPVFLEFSEDPCTRVSLWFVVANDLWHFFLVVVHVHACMRGLQGTTSVRTLESMYWHGVRILHGKKWAQEPYHSNCIEINQWDPYMMLDSLGSEGLPSVYEAFTAVRESAQEESVSGITRLLIVPGYRFRVYVKFLTNGIMVQQLSVLWDPYMHPSWRKGLCTNQDIFLSVWFVLCV
jgi:S-adenosylmethionine:tRNA-ribosyltransferase-isomerase (queuine synthetase)